MIRRIPTRQRNASIAREPDRGAFVRLTLLLICGLILAAGFVYAGGQHFASIRYGYQTQDLRKVRDQLIEERRRFLLAREAAASPMRLEKAARELGLQPLQAAQIDPLRRATTTALVKAPAEPEAAPARKPALVSVPGDRDKRVTSKSSTPAKVSMAAKGLTRDSRKKPI